MGWSEWPSWLKGGGIGSIVGLFILFIEFFFCGNYSLTGLAKVFCGTIAFPLFPTNLLLYMSSISTIIFNQIPVTVVIYFILGAIVGWIVGKIRNRG